MVCCMSRLCGANSWFGQLKHTSFHDLHVAHGGKVCWPRIAGRRLGER